MSGKLPPSKAADASLLAQWRDARSAEAFRILVTRHSGMVYGTCRRMIGNAVAAEDLTQECFLQLAETRTQVGAYLPAWLHTVAANRARDYLRAEKRRGQRELRYEEQRDKTTEIGWNDVAPLVDEAIAELPPEIHEPIVRCFLEGEDRKAIAESLGLSRRAVSYRIERGITSIRRHLSRRGVPMGAAACAALLSANALETASAQLLASMGKVALAGPVSSAVTVTVPNVALLGGILAMKVKLVGIGLLVAILLGVTLYASRNQPANPESAEFGGQAPTDSASRDTVASAEASSDATRAPAESENLERLSDESAADLVAVEAALEAIEPGKILDPEKYASVSGFVRDASGGPIPGADVLLIATGYFAVDVGEEDSPLFIWSDEFKEDFDFLMFDERHHFSARSGPSGSFEISDVEYEGNGLLVATADGHASDAKPVVLSPGKDLENVELMLRPGVTFSGRVITRTGQPVSDAVVREVGGLAGNSYWAGGREFFAHTDPRGYFKLGFRDAELAMLHVASPTHGQHTFENVQVGGSEVVTLEMGETASIQVRVAWSDGSAGSKLSVILRGHYVFQYSRHNGDSMRSTGDGRVIKAVLDDIGEYTFENLDAGQTYAIDVFDLTGAQLVEGAQIGYAEGGSLRRWEFTVDAPIRVHGRVTGIATGSPLSGIQVFYFKQESEIFLQGRVQTDRDGRYEFNLLTGLGDYAIFPKYAHQNFTYFSGDPNQALIALDRGTDHEVDLTFPEPFAISFQVHDAAGTPLPDVHAELRSGVGGAPSEYSRDLYTNAGGRFAYDGFEPNRETWVTFSRKGFASTESAHYNGESGEVFPEETVVLYGAAGVQGVVQYPDGYPMSSVNVRITVRFEDGKSTRLSAMSDLDGFFSVPKGVPATRVSFEISVPIEAENYTWQSGEAEAEPGRFLDVGMIQLTPAGSGE